MACESPDKNSSKFPRISARPGANGNSIRIIDPASSKVVGYYVTNDPLLGRSCRFDIKSVYNLKFIEHLRNAHKIFDLSLPALRREVRAIGEYAVRCGRISDPDPVAVLRERQQDSALLSHIAKFKGDFRGWASDDTAATMARGIQILEGARQTDVSLGRGDAYYDLFLRLLTARPKKASNSFRSRRPLGQIA
jgi:hypothetical protein